MNVQFAASAVAHYLPAPLGGTEFYPPVWAESGDLFWLDDDSYAYRVHGDVPGWIVTTVSPRFRQEFG